jgi:hypothetical protein
MNLVLIITSSLTGTSSTVHTDKPGCLEVYIGRYCYGSLEPAIVQIEKLRLRERK